MTYTVSGGALEAIHRPSYTAPTSVRLSDNLRADYAQIYASQPEVRVVVEFMARNVSQLALQTFERLGDNDRRRLTDHPLAALLAKPNPWTTLRRLVRDTVSDRGIYDRALWVKAGDGNGTPWLLRMPPALWKIDPLDKSWLAPSRFEVTGSRGKRMVDAADVVYFRGYNPLDARQGLSPIESLRRTLAEEYAAGVHREQTLRNGARFSGYITRPASNKEWSDTARTRFKAGWRGQFQGWSATEGGGTPVLEDGMEFHEASQTAEQLQYVEARKLTREEVAAAYFIPPPMIGILDHATFSNITEQHKMLYQDTLGPILAEFSDELGLQLIPDWDTTGNIYVEFNMMEKLRGSFEEQAAQLQTSVGAPWLSRNEVRARMNLSPIDGGDELVVPLNVLVGGQASPTDSAPPAVGAAAAPLHALELKSSPSRSVKARPASPEIEKAREVLADYFGRQGRSVRSAIAAGTEEWWATDRWNRELGNTLYALSSQLTPEIAVRTLLTLGEDVDAYDVDRTLPFLRAWSDGNAKRINESTYEEVAAALASEDPPAGTRDVFEKAQSVRSVAAAMTVATALAGFASSEAAKQVAGPRTATKSWLVTSKNPRSSHSAMNGQTVGIDEKFSNGADWPGDAALGADEIAGCTCDLLIRFVD